LLPVEVLGGKDLDHAMLLADRHRDPVEALETTEEKLSYFAGALDALTLVRSEEGRKGGNGG
jgi:hypothetical protein